MTFIRACIFGLLASSLTFSAAAEWSDPLETPAMSSQKGHQALLLDITHAGQRLVAAGAFGNILWSDDQGSSWQQASVPVRVTLTALTFADASHGWAVGHDGVILATNDSGQSWQLQLDGHQANKAMIAASEILLERAEEVLAEAEESGDDIAIEEAEMAAEDASFALEDAQYDYESGSTKPFLDVSFLTPEHGFAVGAYGMAFETRDGGNSWRQFTGRLPISEKLHLNSITKAAYGRLFLVGEMGLILTSDDSGKNWQQLESPYDGSLFNLVSNGNELLLMGLRGHVYESADAGQHWRELQVDNEQTLIGATVTGQNEVVLVGNGGAVVTIAADDSSRVHTVQGRKGLAAVAATDDGTFVVVGEAGVQRIQADASLLKAAGMNSSNNNKSPDTGVSSAATLATEEN